MSSEDLLLERLQQLPDVTIVSPTTPYRRGRVCGIEPMEWGVSVRLSSCHVVFEFDRPGNAYRDLPFTLWLETPAHALDLPNGDLALSTGNSVVIVHKPGCHLSPDGFTTSRDLSGVLLDGPSCVLAVDFSTNREIPLPSDCLAWSDDAEPPGMRSVHVGRPGCASVDVRELRLTVEEAVDLTPEGGTPALFPVEIALNRDLPVFALPCGASVMFSEDRVVFFI